MLPNEEGKYIALPRKWTLGESKNGAVEFAVDFALCQWFSDQAGEWQDIRADGCAIVGYFYPINKSGQIVDMTVQSLQESLGWSGATLKELADGDWSKTEVQLVLQREEYNGRTQMKVKFLNPRDFAGGNGLKAADPQAVQSLDNKYGAILRANPNKKAAPASAPASGQPPLSDNEKERRIAYAAVCNKFKPDTAQKKADIWLEVVGGYFKKPQQHVTAAEWKKFVADDFVPPTPANPISQEMQFKEEDIPF